MLKKVRLLKTEAKRKLKSLDVNFISLVSKGANKKTLIYKSDKPSEKPNLTKTLKIAKLDEEQRSIYCIVYSPGEVDTQGDIVEDVKIIKEASDNFMKNGRTTKVDKGHDFVADEGFVAENWLTKENDSVFPDDPVGSWAVRIQVENDETWEQVKKGEITGVSLDAMAVVEEVKKEDDDTLIQKVADKVKSIFKREEKTSVSKDFNEELLKQTLKANYAALLNSLDQIYYSSSDLTSMRDNMVATVKQFTKSIQTVEIKKSNNNNSNEENEMNKEEIQKAITDGIAEGLKSVNEKIEAIEKSVNDKDNGLAAVIERVEKVEKATPGSQQIKKEAAGTKEVSIWT